MTEVEKAYFAGIIDGEGTITLSKDGEFRYPVISFCNNDKSIIDYIQQFCHGTITCKKSTNANWKDNYVWHLERRRAIEVINEILPYMHEQRKIARAMSIITEYVKLTPRNGKYTNEMRILKHKWEDEFFLL